MKYKSKKQIPLTNKQIIEIAVNSQLEDLRTLLIKVASNTQPKKENRKTTNPIINKG